MSTDQIIKSPYPDLTLPHISTWHFLFDRSDDAVPNDDHPVFVDCQTEKQLMFGQLRTLTKRLASGLVNRKNLVKGDRVISFTSLTLMMPAVALATQAASLCLTFAPHNLTLDQLVDIITDSQPKLLLVGETTLPMAKQAASKCDYPQDLIYMIEKEGCNEIKSVWSIAGEEEFEPAKLSEREVKEMTAFLCYSSGTTDKAKGIETTHYNLTSTILQAISTTNTDPNGKWFCSKIEHISGILLSLFMAPYQGATVYCCEEVTPQSWLGTIQKYRITSMYFLPYLAFWFVRDPIVDQYDLSSVRTVAVGGGALSEYVATRLEQHFGFGILAGYGLSETTGVITAADVQTKEKRGTVGRLLPNMTAKLVGGELLLKGPNITKGYFKNPKKTSELFTEDGWMKTGDACEIDEDGYLSVIGRMEDLIFFKGIRIAPEAIETVICQHPDVKDAAIIPIYDHSQESEVPKAFVALVPAAKGKPDIEDDIIKWVAERVPDHQTLRGGVHVSEVIPRGRTGKVLRTALRGKYPLNESKWSWV